MTRLPRFGLLAAVALTICGCTAGRHYYDNENESVSFYLYAPGAGSVYFASSLDDFQPHRARSDGMGGWLLRLPAAKEFRYFYLLDGEIYLPSCRYREKDDFGSENCIYHPPM